jgi:hypothetical protein
MHRHYVPAAWDPIYAIASDIRASFVEPIRAAILHALDVLTEIAGQEPVAANDLAVDAFAYTLVDVLTREERIAEPRRSLLLQLLAAQTFHSASNPSIANTAFFWVFLNELSDKYRSNAGGGDDLTDLSAVLEEFLAYYHLDGPDNEDVVRGIERLVLPHIRRVRQDIRDRFALLGAGPPGP